MQKKYIRWQLLLHLWLKVKDVDEFLNSSISTDFIYKNSTDLHI